MLKAVHVAIKKIFAQKDFWAVERGQEMTIWKKFYPKMIWIENTLQSLKLMKTMINQKTIHFKKWLFKVVESHVLPKLVFILRQVKSFTGPYMVLIKNKLQPHNFIRIRQRDVFTRGNKLRLRYVTGSLACICVSLATLSGFVSNSWAVKSEDKNYDTAEIVEFIPPVEDKNLAMLASYIEGSFVGEANAVDTKEPEKMPNIGDLASPKLFENPVSEMLKNKVSDGMRQASHIIKKSKKPLYKELKIGQGDTVAGLLSEAGVQGSDAYQVVKAIGKHYDLRKVRPGQKLMVHYASQKDEDEPEFTKLVMKLDPQKEVTVFKDGDKFKSEIIEKDLIERSYAGKAEIKTSLYGSAARAGIPSQVIAEVIRIYSWDIDFQRDLRQGDKIEVLYNTTETEEGEFVKYGQILYANLQVRGKKMPIYRYEMADGRADYFSPNGRSIRKTLMATPVDGARISSGFGMRHHPVLGYNKMHKGIDFAAPTGTPIYAAGDGTVEFVGRNGGYGNYVRIRHNGSIKTAYAHMHHFAKGMKKGKFIEQGKIIGYIGTTGRSTGPHLHYEVLKNNKQVNPRRLDLPTGELLKGKKLEKFKTFINGIHQQYVSLSEGVKYAMNNGSKQIH